MKNDFGKEERYISLFEKLAKDNGVTFEYKFKANVGRYNRTENKVYCSKPINAERLQVAIHEIAHKLFWNIKPSYLQEYLCECYSFEILRNNNIPIKEKVKARSKNYIAIVTQKAVNRGLKQIEPRVKNYIKKDYPSVANLEKGFIQFYKPRGNN